jgi:hypothetical protein
MVARIAHRGPVGGRAFLCGTPNPGDCIVYRGDPPIPKCVVCANLGGKGMRVLVQATINVVHRTTGTA